MKNVCVVGYGAIGKTHAEALKNVDNATLYAVCDINYEKAEQCGKQYQVSDKTILLWYNSTYINRRMITSSGKKAGYGVQR